MMSKVTAKLGIKDRLAETLGFSTQPVKLSIEDHYAQAAKTLQRQARGKIGFHGIEDDEPIEVLYALIELRAADIAESVNRANGYSREVTIRGVNPWQAYKASRGDSNVLKDLADYYGFQGDLAPASDFLNAAIAVSKIVKVAKAPQEWQVQAKRDPGFTIYRPGDEPETGYTSLGNRMRINRSAAVRAAEATNHGSTTAQRLDEEDPTQPSEDNMTAAELAKAIFDNDPIVSENATEEEVKTKRSFPAK
jgi:hypothetical protein